MLFKIYILCLKTVYCHCLYIIFKCFNVGFYIIIFVRFIFTSSCLLEGACFIYAMCVCLRIVVSNTYCVVFVWFPSSCVPYFASISGLCFLFIAPSVFSNVYFAWLVILNHPYQSNEQHILPSNHSTQQMTFTYLAGNAGPGLLIAFTTYL